MIENTIALIICAVLTATAKSNKSAGYLVVAYYLVYMAIDLSEFGDFVGNVFQSVGSSVVWYIICTSLSALFSLWASILYVTKGGAIYLYAIWLIFDAIICSILALSQVLETNTLLFMYNILQNINLYVDILVVIVGTDHIIKRKFSVAAHIIDSVNSCAERWLNLVFNSSFKGAPKCKKN